MGMRDKARELIQANPQITAQELATALGVTIEYAYDLAPHIQKYNQARELMRANPTWTASNLMTALNCTRAIAQWFLQKLDYEGVIRLTTLDDARDLIRANPTISKGELARRLDVGLYTISEILRKLKAEGVSLMSPATVKKQARLDKVREILEANPKIKPGEAAAALGCTPQQASYYLRQLTTLHHSDYDDARELLRAESLTSAELALRLGVTVRAADAWIRLFNHERRYETSEELKRNPGATPDDLREMEYRHWLETHTSGWRAMAKEFNVPERAVADFCRARNIRREVVTNYDKIKAALPGNIHEIMARTGISKDKIYYIVRERGLKLTPIPDPMEQKARPLPNWFTEISGAELNLTRKCFRRYLRVWRLRQLGRIQYGCDLFTAKWGIERETARKAREYKSRVRRGATCEEIADAFDTPLASVKRILYEYKRAIWRVVKLWRNQTVWRRVAPASRYLGIKGKQTKKSRRNSTCRNRTSNATSLT